MTENPKSEIRNPNLETSFGPGVDNKIYRQNCRVCGQRNRAEDRAFFVALGECHLSCVFHPESAEFKLEVERQIRATREAPSTNSQAPEKHQAPSTIQ